MEKTIADNQIGGWGMPPAAHLWRHKQPDRKRSVAESDADCLH